MTYINLNNKKLNLATFQRIAKCLSSSSKIKVIEELSSGTVFTVSKVAELAGITQGLASKITTELSECGAITKTRPTKKRDIEVKINEEFQQQLDDCLRALDGRV